MDQMNIAIIGAGATGLAAAWDFADAGHQVTIYEAADRVGGLAAGFKDEAWDWTLEKFYHHWFASDYEILALAEEMGVPRPYHLPPPKNQLLGRRETGPQRDFAIRALPAAFVRINIAHGAGGHVRQTHAALAAIRARHRRSMAAPLDGAGSLREILQAAADR